MALLILGLVLFLGAHSVSIVAEDFRNRMAARSEIGWKAAYGVAALLGLYLIVQGYGAARTDPVLLWAPPVWTRHLAALLLLPIFVLFLASYLPGRIKAVTRHPQLVAVKLWAAGHLLANGTLADVILFGSFLGWGVADRISLKRRKQPRTLPTAPPSGANDVIAIVAGLVLYVVFALWLHQAWIGVYPFG